VKARRAYLRSTADSPACGRRPRRDAPVRRTNLHVVSRSMNVRSSERPCSAKLGVDGVSRAFPEAPGQFIAEARTRVEWERPLRHRASALRVRVRATFGPARYFIDVSGGWLERRTTGRRWRWYAGRAQTASLSRTRRRRIPCVIYAAKSTRTSGLDPRSAARMPRHRRSQPREARNQVAMFRPRRRKSCTIRSQPSKSRVVCCAPAGLFAV